MKKTEVVVIIGAAGIGMAIARCQGFGKHILLADYNETLLAAAAKELEVASYKVSSLKVDVSSRESVRALADKRFNCKIAHRHVFTGPRGDLPRRASLPIHSYSIQA